MNKLISIILPTYNRAGLLQYTLSLLVPQLEECIDDVELVICNNASTDTTKDVLLRFQNEFSFIRTVNYEEHLDIGNSIARSILNASGVYYLLWRDDDIPAPFMIRMYLDAIKNNPNVACVVGNRLLGDSQPEGFGVNNLRIHDSFFTQDEIVFESSDVFIRRFAGAMGFLSVDLIRRDIWERNLGLFENDCWGYEFLLPMLAGLKGELCVYINYPTCIQRFFYNPRYKAHWVKYAYIGMPRLLRKLESLGIITDWFDGFSQFKYNQSSLDFIGSVMNICWKNRGMYLPLVDELLSYQRRRIRRLFIKSIRRPAICMFFYRAVYFFYKEYLHLKRIK